MNQHIRDTRTQRRSLESYARIIATKDSIKEILSQCKNHSERKRTLEQISQNGTIKFTNKKSEMICFNIDGIDFCYEWKNNKWVTEPI